MKPVTWISEIKQEIHFKIYVRLFRRNKKKRNLALYIILHSEVNVILLSLSKDAFLIHLA